MKRATVVAGLTLVSCFALRGQSPVQNPKINDLLQERVADFNIREAQRSAVSGGYVAALSAGKTLREQRSENLEAYRLSVKEEDRASLRLIPNAFGLPKVLFNERRPLTQPSDRDPAEIAKDFLRANQAAFTLTDTEIANLDLTVRDVTDRAVFLQFDQTVDGIRVFRGHVKISLNRAGQVVQAGMADVVPGVNVTTRPRLDAREAVQFAFKTLGLEPPAELIALTSRQQGKMFFANPLGGQYNPIRVELSVFPMTASSARLAYRLYLESGSSGSYEILIDARDGRLLSRRNLTRFLAQGRVWKESPIKGDRELVDFADGWLPQSGVVTTGNNADAYVDTNMGPLPDIRNGRAFSAVQVFDFPVSEDTTGRDFGEFKAAAVTNLFYFVNTAHDYFYDLGFTESAGNFQTDNFGRGGKGNDAVLAKAHVGFENASISVAGDGFPPRIEMGVRLGFKDGLKYFDLSYAGDVVMHECGHGLTLRIVGGPDNVTCLDGTQSWALDEGWGDYFGISFFDDPVFGEYSSQDSVRGVRRQGYEGYTYTYEDLGNEGFEVHDDGEIWAAALWDLRKELGQEVTDQLVVDGVKFTPCGPSMIDARDGILMADQTINGAANRAKIWEVFARHGMGNSAGGIDGSSLLKDTVYNAAFDLPPDLQPGNRSPAITSQPPAVIPRLGDAYVYDQCCPGKVAPTDGKSLPLNVLWPVLPGNDLKSRGRKWPPERSIPTRHNGG